MTPIPLLEIIFAFFQVILLHDTASFTVVQGYSPDDPITWTRIESRSTWKAVSRKGLDHGTWRLHQGTLTVTLNGASKTTDLSKYIRGDLDITSPQQHMKVLGHELKVIHKDDRYTIATEGGGPLDTPVTAIKRTKRSRTR
jgi:hypothetical protein